MNIQILKTLLEDARFFYCKIKHIIIMNVNYLDEIGVFVFVLFVVGFFCFFLLLFFINKTTLFTNP